MVKIWYMNDDETTDQRLEHHLNPPQFLEISELFKTTGVEYIKLNAKTFQEDGLLDKIKKARNYSYEDEITCSKECLQDYENKLKHFYAEHLHTDEEIRFVVDGSGYFDVRDVNDKWIRISVSAGDMIVIPAGIYHRFTLDVNNYIQAKRLFIGEPVWLPYNRPVDEMACRKEYLSHQAESFKNLHKPGQFLAEFVV
ncbi:ADI1 family protein [Megaselia abdita]